MELIEPTLTIIGFGDTLNPIITCLITSFNLWKTINILLLLLRLSFQYFKNHFNYGSCIFASQHK